MIAALLTEDRSLLLGIAMPGHHVLIPVSAERPLLFIITISFFANIALAIFPAEVQNSQYFSINLLYNDDTICIKSPYQGAT